MHTLLSNEYLGFTSLGVGYKHAATSDEPAKLAAPDAFQLGVLPSKHWVGTAAIADKLDSKAAVVVIHCLSFPSYLSIFVLYTIVFLVQGVIRQICISSQSLHILFNTFVNKLGLHAKKESGQLPAFNVSFYSVPSSIFFVA